MDSDATGGLNNERRPELAFYTNDELAIELIHRGSAALLFLFGDSDSLVKVGDGGCVFYERFKGSTQQHVFDVRDTLLKVVEAYLNKLALTAAELKKKEQENKDED